MNCAEARSYVPLLSLQVPGEFSVEMQSVRRHLDVCPDCRAAWEAEVVEDKALASRMMSVPVPADYGTHLLRQLVVDRPVVGTALPSVGRRRHWWLAVSALSLVFVISGLFLMWRLTPAAIESQDLLAFLDRCQVSADWPPSPRTDRPYGWSQVPGLVSAPPLQSPHGPIPVHAVPFQYRPRRSAESVSGILWIVDAARISAADSLPSLRSAEIEYGADRSRLIWNENGIVYLLETDATALQRLHEMLRESRPVA